jgi:D-amino-acid oxidase
MCSAIYLGEFLFLALLFKRPHVPGSAGYMHRASSPLPIATVPHPKPASQSPHNSPKNRHRLQTEAYRQKITIHRKIFHTIHEALAFAPAATAIINCTGLGSLTLGGVLDQKLFAARGQILLIESPNPPLKTMYFRAPDRDGEATHVFPRGDQGSGGVILGGCRQKHNWNGEVELAFAEVIKARCCALAPELGRPEDLRVVKHGVGLRREFSTSPFFPFLWFPPFVFVCSFGGVAFTSREAADIRRQTAGREGGARIEPEIIDGRLVIHNYGAGGTGFQASW